MILAVAHWIDQPGGSQKIAFDEATELARRGDEVWMLAHAGPSLPAYERRDGIHYLRYFPKQVPVWSVARRSVHQNAVKAVLHRHLPQVDVIHGHIHLAYSAALEFYGPKVFSCFTLHSPAKLEMAAAWRGTGVLRAVTAPLALRALNRLEARCLSESNVTTALSQYTADCVRALHGDPLAQRLEVVPGWVDTLRYTPTPDRQPLKAELGWPTDMPTLLTIRRLVSRMGLERLVAAAHLLHQEGLRFQLVIGGDGPLRARLETQIAALGLQASVHLVGRVPEDRMADSYAACDAFVLPTLALECFGIIVLEGLAAGRPVLATPVGAIPEILRRFEPEWLAQGAETAEIANLLRAYLTGKLPEPSPAELHTRVDHLYGRSTGLANFLARTVDRWNQ